MSASSEIAGRTDCTSAAMAMSVVLAASAARFERVCERLAPFPLPRVCRRVRLQRAWFS